MSTQNRYQDNLEKEREQNRRKKRRLALGLGAGMLVLAAAGWFLLSGTISEKRYAQRMREGNQYLIAMDYDAAEIAYQRALEEQPEEPEAYEKLASIYIAQNRYEEAGELLVSGIRKTNAQSLIKTYERVSLVLDTMGEEDLAAGSLSADDLLRISQNLTADAAVYDVVASYTYQDYVRAYGKPVTAEANAYRGKDVRFDGFPETVCFRHASYGYDRADAVTFENLSDVIGNYRGAASGASLEVLFGCSRQITAADRNGEKQYYVSFVYHGCTLTVESDANGDIYGNAANVLYPNATDEDEKDTKAQRTAAGYIINAVDGGGVQASLRFISGGRYGKTAAEASASGDGSFSIQVAPGQYTVEIRAAGFITAYEEISVPEGTDARGLNFTISPELEEGEIRIVLTWSARPVDLDAHLEGTGSGGQSVDISFAHMSATNVADLDIDDRSGYGPETVTIHDVGGNYTFRVHNYSSDYDSVPMSQSGAVVKIYRSDDSTPVTYTLPAGDGIWWNVCRISGGTITPVNTLQ